MAKTTAQNRIGRTKKIALLALMLALTIIFCFVPIQFGTITLALMILPTLILAQVCDFKTSLFMGVLMGLINYIAWFTTKAASPIAPIFQNPVICLVPRMLIAVVAYWSRIGLEKLVIVKWMKIAPTPAPNEEILEDDESALLDDGNVDEIAIECKEENLVDSGVEFVDDVEDKAAEITEKPVKSARAKEIAARQGIHLVSTALGVITNTLFVAIFTLIFFNNTAIAENTIITVEYVLAWFSLNFAIEVVAFSLITPPIATAIRAAKLV